MELTDSVQSFRSDAPAKKNQCRIPLGTTVLSPGHFGTVPYHLSQMNGGFPEIVLPFAHSTIPSDMRIPQPDHAALNAYH